MFFSIPHVRDDSPDPRAWPSFPLEHLEQATQYRSLPGTSATKETVPASRTSEGPSDPISERAHAKQFPKQSWRGAKPMLHSTLQRTQVVGTKTPSQPGILFSWTCEKSSMTFPLVIKGMEFFKGLFPRVIAPIDAHTSPRHLVVPSATQRADHVR